jgi:hypothetical protein
MSIDGYRLPAMSRSPLVNRRTASWLDSADNDYSNKTVGNPVETAGCAARPDDHPIDPDRPGLFDWWLKSEHLMPISHFEWGGRGVSVLTSQSQGRSGSRLNGQWRSAMTMVVVTHAVGNMETWLKGSENRKAVFSKFCSNHRIFKHAETNRVSILWENVDLAKMQETMGAAETAKAKAADTVIDPVEIYIEVEGGK